MSNIDLERLYSLDPIEFENMVKTLFIKMGFNAATTKASGDGGIDIVAINEQPITSGKYVIQCKRYGIGNNIGEPTIRELFGVMHAENANKGILITTSEFTKQAVVFAKGKAIELINGHDLQNLLNRYLTEIEDKSSYVSETQAQAALAKTEKFLSEFELLIEREKIRTTKQSLDLVTYAQYTNPGSNFRNDFCSIVNYHLDHIVLKIFNEIAEKVNSGSYAKDIDYEAAFGVQMASTLADPSKKAILSLIDDYCDKTFRFYKNLVSISPPSPALHVHEAYIEATIQFLKLFSLLREYLKTTNKMEKALYTRYIHNCEQAVMAKQEGLMSATSDLKAEVESGRHSTSKGPCFIATVAYGNAYSTEVNILRAWRDNYLSQKIIGRQFIKFYYIIGPVIADYIADGFFLKRIIRVVLDRFVFVLRERGNK